MRRTHGSHLLISVLLIASLLTGCKKRLLCDSLWTNVNGTEDTLCLGAEYQPPVYWILNCDDDTLTTTTTVSGNLNIHLRGDYSVTISITRTDGVEKEQVRNVHVLGLADKFAEAYSVECNCHDSIRRVPPVQVNYSITTQRLDTLCGALVLSKFIFGPGKTFKNVFFSSHCYGRNYCNTDYIANPDANSELYSLFNIVYNKMEGFRRTAGPFSLNSALYLDSSDYYNSSHLHDVWYHCTSRFIPVK
jgi:hypothetical protein